MTPFRYILFSALLTISVFSIVLVSSCKNKCGSTTCQNGGICTDNKCVCLTGFSGNACQTGWSDVFVGTYNCTKNSCVPTTNGAATWQSAITKSATNAGYTVYISNFDNSNTTVTAIIDSAVAGTSSIVVSTASGTYGINATGHYTNGTINLHFTTSAVGGVGGYQCNMVMVKE